MILIIFHKKNKETYHHSYQKTLLVFHFNKSGKDKYEKNSINISLFILVTLLVFHFDNLVKMIMMNIHKTYLSYF